MITPLYNCSQEELYIAARLGWASFLEYLPKFTEFKPKYTAAYADERLTEVTAAENLPNNQTRGADTEIGRVKLLAAADEALENWQKLKRYNTDAFPPEFLKAKNEAAGQNYYEKARGYSWENCSSLFKSGSRFIADNLTALVANLNMPASFQDKFDTAAINFQNLLQEFLNSEESGSIGSSAKTLANNDVYKKFTSMLQDGQQIFKNNEAVKKQFIFDQILSLISGPGTAGLRGTITNSTTLEQIINALLSIKEIKKSTTTDEDGKYLLTQVASGTYTIIITAEGFEPKEILLQEVKVGTISTLNISLTPIQ